MSFKQSYPITKKYLMPHTKRRPGILISPKVRFLVAHDTGNAGSTAIDNVNYYERTCNKEYASAHIFVDDKEIIECIPSISTTKPEKAWHVRYKTANDNKLYGSDANDTAIGVEYCFGGEIDGQESYRRYVWTLAFLCYKYKLTPEKDIVAHSALDPGRKIDPENGLGIVGKTFRELLDDVKKSIASSKI